MGKLHKSLANATSAGKEVLTIALSNKMEGLLTRHAQGCKSDINGR